MVAQLQQPNCKLKHLVHDGELLRYKHRIWVGGNQAMQHKILHTLHEGVIGGHSGIQATLQRVRQLFAWPRMQQIVQSFVEACTICKQAKTEHVRYPGLLKPLAVPQAVWQVVTLDFVEGLPKYKGFTTELVVVGKLTKYAYFLPLAHPYTAAQEAQVYIDNVFKLYGMPAALVSDRDIIFTSQLWHSLFALSKIELRMSTTYHPQTDGRPSE
jgi:hypothetical protein